MKGQIRDRTVFIFTTLILFVTFATFKFYDQSKELYAQSEVSALMKFNASEFGCEEYEIVNKNPLRVVCYQKYTIFGKWWKFELFDDYSYHTAYSEVNGIWELPIVVDYNLPRDTDKKIDSIGSFVVGKISSENISYLETWFDNETAIMNVRLKNKTLTYLPSWSNVSVVLEPERQVCVNKTWEILEGSWCVFESGTLACRCNGCINKFVNFTTQKCTTIPAVEKQFSGWAENENDPATEFCRAKNYTEKEKKLKAKVVCPSQVWPSTKDCELVDEQNNPIRGCKLKDAPCVVGDSNLFILGDYCIQIECDNSEYDFHTYLKSKPFTRGEVVEVDKEVKSQLWVKQILGKKDIIKQKVVRCSNGSYSQDFEVFG